MGDLDLRRVAGVQITQRRNEGFDFHGGVHRVDHVAPIGAQHAALIGDAYRRRAVAQRVDGARECAARPVVLAAAAYRTDVIVPGAQRLDEARNLLRRVLQIRIHRDDGGALRALEAGHDGGVLAEVALQDDDARFRGAQRVLRPKDRHRAIPAAVVDEDAFIRDPEAIEDGIEAREESRQPGLLVEHGNDDA